MSAPITLITVESGLSLMQGPGELSGLLEAGERPAWSAPAVVIADAQIGSYLTFSREEWRELLGKAMGLAPGERSLERLSLLLQEGGSSLVVEASERPDQTAAVVDGDRVLGAWVPHPAPRRGRAVGRGAARSPSSPSAAPPPPGAGVGMARAPDIGSLDHAPDARRRDSAPASPAEAAPVAEAGPSGPAPEQTIRRTPHIDAPRELDVAPGSTFAVVVRADDAPMAEEEEGREIVLEVPAEVSSVTLDVVVTVSSHFEIEGSSTATLELHKEETRSKELEFTLTVTEAGTAGEAGVEVLFVHKGRPCGTVRRVWEWDPDGNMARAVRLGDAVDPSIPVYTEAVRPDLSVFIMAPRNDGMSFTCSVSTELLPGMESPSPAVEFAIHNGANDFVSDQLQRFIDPNLSDTERRRELLAAGHEFWAAAPELFKGVLRKLIEKGGLRSILIASVEPHLPWELMIPSFKDANGLPVDREPLGVEFAVGRWVRGDSKFPPQRLPVRNAFVIAPNYPSGKELDASAEIDLLSERAAGIQLVPAEVDALDRRLTEETASILHFACHGAAGVSDDDAVYLDGNALLRAGVVRTLDGFKKLCREERPLIFLNSCETGRLVPSLSGAAGFPRTFSELGARAIIAPIWPVLDSDASDVAVEVYRRALDDPHPPLAEILRELRARAYRDDKFSDTLAAYCFYGDPLTRLEPA